MLSIQILIFFLGAVVMGFEMLASRYLYPYFGGSIETWGALIATVLAALMIGYFLGGFLADRVPDLRISGFLVAISAAWISVVPFLSELFLPLLLETVGDGAISTILASCILMLLPISLLGTLLPFVIRVIIIDMAYTGRVAGLSYAVSTCGNIMGTLVVTFMLIPNFGVRSITELIAIVTFLGAIGLYVIGRRK